MCPVCISTTAVMAASATSTGGLTALLVKKLLRTKDGMKAISAKKTGNEKEKSR